VRICYTTYVKAGPAGGRLRRPSSRRQRHDGTAEPASTRGPLAKGLYYRPAMSDSAVRFPPGTSSEPLSVNLLIDSTAAEVMCN
jgi:hypothetical protein